VRLFDCIEFNPALRIMDSIGEVALLAMDLQARGHGRECHWLLSDYLEYTGDYEGLALLDLFRSYFAMVRAKVALLREPANLAGIQGTAAYGDFCRYLELAGAYDRAPAPFLAITHGVSGSGKSTVADKLVAASGAIRIRSDVERKRLFGLAPEQRSRAQDKKTLYSSAMSRTTFDRLEQLALQTLGAGFPVIVDATFLHRRSRDDFRQLAQRLGVPFAIIDCNASGAQLRQRLVARELRGRDASEAGVRVMENQLKVDQPPAGVELAHLVPAASDEDADTLWGRLRGQVAG
jgi:predicted kinase